jgi:uncharacterized protein YktB (UPF0637 family)
MTAEKIQHQLQQNLLKIGLLNKQINRVRPIEHDELKIGRLYKKIRKIVETNNKLLLQLEELE